MAATAVNDRGIVSDQTSLLRIATVAVKRWRVLSLVPTLAAVLALLASFLIPPSYTATSTFVPEERGQTRAVGSLGNLAGLASQFGVSVGADPTQSPRFYAKVAGSREILQRLLLTRFDSKGKETTDSATLLQLLDIRGRNHADSVFKGVNELRRRLSVSVDNQTNIVTVSVKAADRDLAAAATNTLVGYLNEFNSEVRRSQAHERRVFVENRVTQGEDDLRRAEQALRDFLERNRSWQQSPQLVFEEGRLRRQLDIRQEIYLTLRREYETARIEEVNDVPLITIIDAAIPPVRRSWPRRSFLIILAAVVTGLGCLVWIAALEYLERARQEQSGEYNQFSTALASARTEAGRLFTKSPRQKS
jgi:uncharacterized protein involved in exopolysaccharide biosynthesis